MTGVNFTLNTADGDVETQERQLQQVPAVGEMVTFEWRRTFQVADVLWHVQEDATYATVTAYEVDWHQYVNKVAADWRARLAGG